MRNKTRLFHVFMTLFFSLSSILYGCKQQEAIQEYQTSKLTQIKTVPKVINAEYGDTPQLIKKAMMKIEEFSVVEQVKVIDEQQGIYQFSDYTIHSSINYYEGKENAQLHIKLSSSKQDLLTSEEYQFYVSLQDTMAPIINLKQDSIEIYESQTIDFNSYVNNISDNFDKEISIQHIEINIPKENNKFQCGDYEVIYQAVDTHGNQGEKRLKVKVLKDEVVTSQPVSLNLENNDINTLAKSLVGKPYVWGGKGPDGFDCSGIIMYLYKCIGFDVSWAQIQYGQGNEISLDKNTWKIGDVLSYQDNSGEIVHHALYLGNGMALHAIVAGVQILPVDTAMESGFNNPQRLVRVRRYL